MKKLLINSLVVISFVGIGLLTQVHPAIAAEQTVSFKDIKKHWAKAAIDAAVKNRYFKGYDDGTFKPDEPVTRAEFAASLARASKVEDEKEQTNVFADLVGHWSEAEVNRAVSLGYINASDYPNGFKPSTPITRVEISKWMASGLAAADVDYRQALQDTVTTVLPVKEYFNPGIPQSESPYIAISLGTKLMSGYPDGSFGLTKQATRAEASTILLRLNTVSQQKADSFVGLNELREVGTKRTNMEIISPFSTNNSSFDDIAEKTYTFRNNAGTLKFHHLIMVDTQDFKNQKGIYAPLFVDENEYVSRLDKRGVYRAYVEITIYPKTEHFSLSHYYNGVDGIVSGSRTGNDNSNGTDNSNDKYGYLTVPNLESEEFFSHYRNGKGVRLWVLKYIDVGYPRTSMTTDDGSYANFDIKKE